MARQFAGPTDQLTIAERIPVSDEFTIRGVLTVLNRRRSLIYIGIAACFLIGVTVCFFLTRSSRYNATTTPDRALNSARNSGRLKLNRNMEDYWRPPARTRGPNTASSIVVVVDKPTYLPPLCKPAR